MKLQSWLAGALAAALLVVAPAAASAQSTLASSEAVAFMGTWTVTLESPQGAFEQTLTLKDAAGKVAGELVSPIAPEATPLNDITKAGADLVIKFEGNFQGMPFTAKITLTPESATKAKVAFDIMDGMFVMNGEATKQ